VAAGGAHVPGNGPTAGEVPVPADAPTAGDAAPATPRQRWRLVLAREAAEAASTGRELADAWEAAVDGTGLPLHRPAGRARARVAFGAPIPAAMALERELADIVLTEMVPRRVVREALAGRLPDGWRLTDIFDVWLGAPALAGQVAAADYRVDLGDVDAVAVAAAAEGLLAADRLPRERVKGTATVTYDLRPLLVDVAVADAGPPLVLRARTRFHPVLGTGRPEEVVAALSDRAGLTLIARAVVRERVILAEDLEGAQGASGSASV
jgi:Uncharacterized protein conserved in bacteria (DUF2344)